MWRLTLSKLTPFWRKAFVLFLAFVTGIGADRVVIVVSPLVYRVVNITTIHGTKGKGCEGSAGTYYALFGRPTGQSDGVFHSACGEHAYLTDHEALFCRCD